METRKLQMLLHPLFLLSLTCLLANDFYWKYEYHNWLTGKLSDFTGLFVLTVFLFAFFPKHKAAACFCIAIFFAWWKTPLSQPVIDLLNNLFSMSFARTVDYSDHLALPVVVTPYFIRPPSLKFSWMKRIAAYSICLVCFFAFCSTTILRKFTIAPDFSYRVSYHDEYKTALTEEGVLRKLDALGLNYKTDSFTITPLTIYGGSLVLKRKDSIDKNWMVISPSQHDTLMYVRINERIPYIAIRDFNAGGEMFPQVNIRIYVDYSSKKTRIVLESVYLNDDQMAEYYSRRSKTKIRIRKVLQKELISKLN